MTENDLDEFFLPRLQIKCVNISSDYRITEWKYELVYKHFDNDIAYVSLGSTKRETGRTEIPLNEDGTLDLPFRDGVHIKHDAIQLNLPAFAICGDIIQKIDLIKFKKKLPERY
ncbi:hypothetical protein H6F38_13985 [Paenibacillus sp. EKM208P]|nr:hypothetical protein H6F38_13985 [Paenibacillus sp. EKM208P]